MIDTDIKSENNHLIFCGTLSGRNIRFTCSRLHDLIENKGYTDIVLDFTKANPVYASFMTPLLPIFRGYRGKKVDYELKLPTEILANKLFKNANWAHYINPEKFNLGSYESGIHVPALQFLNSSEQHNTVERILDIVLGSLENLDRGHIKALEWSLHEITDNVLVHAESQCGGFVQATTWQKRNSIEFIVSDNGIGIPQSLKSLGKINQQEALRKAIEQKVTRDATKNQGNGLFGAYQISVVSEGEFEICSQNASLFVKHGDQLEVKNEKIPYQGTFVRCVIDCNKQNLLEEALVFDGKPHDPPHDFLERKYEAKETDDMKISVAEHKKLLGSRESGAVLRNRITNLLHCASSDHKVIIDFSDVYVISSSVADEAFGKLMSQIGPVEFMQRIELINLDNTVKMLINRAIRQRITQAANGV